MLDSSSGDDHPLGFIPRVQELPDGVAGHRLQPLLGTQKRVAQRVSLERHLVQDLGQDHLGLVLDLADLPQRGITLSVELFVGDERVADRVGEDGEDGRKGLSVGC